MRTRYRLWVCPEPGCAAIKGSTASTWCPTHGRVWEAIIVRREEPETDAQREAREGLEQLRSRGGAGAKIADAMERVARDMGVIK